MALGRSFSFEDHDEEALSSNEQERLSYQYQQQSQPHRNTPARDLVSPPPQYSSPPPRDIVSPPSSSSSPGYYTGAPPTSHYSPPRDVRARRPVPTRQPDDFEAAPPPPPPHRSSPTRTDRYQDSQRWRPQSLVTPGMDNFGGRSEGGGLDRITQSVADRNPRESGVEALRAIERSSPPRSYFPQDRDRYNSSPDPAQRPSRFQERASYASSTMPLAADAATPGISSPRASPDRRSTRFPGHNIPLDDYPQTGYAGYQDSPYLNSSLEQNPALSEASIDPYNIADDGDDGFIPDPKRKSRLNLMKQRSGGSLEGSNQRHGSYPSEAARGASIGALGGIFGRSPKSQTSSGSYDPIRQGGNTEKTSRSEWLSRQTKGNNKMRWIVGGVIIGIVVLATVAGIIGGVVSSKKSSSSSGVDPNSNDNTAAGDTAANGDLDKDSPQIKALLNNPNLHKVFPGIDYTPWGTQYPLCMTYPPSQNNVTRDMAVLSQLTNAVRLYGTDCNQTQMVLHSIDRLGLTDMKIWLGVWIDTNDTTTQRQLAQMYTILEETSDRSIFKGAIVGNEALYRAGLDKASSEASLIQILTDVKAKFTQLGYDLPVATSDLGDNWNAQLATAVDLVMSNIHPFFAGVSASEAAAWTWDFWDTHDLLLTEGTNKKQVISETGWPSDGGRDCGGSTGDCTDAQLTSTDVSIAGIDEMNTYLDTWVCQALANGTEYFWFEAFDEPWKVVYNTPGKDWEDKWGLMDPGRNLKDGLKIPDCGGKTVDSN